MARKVNPRVAREAAGRVPCPSCAQMNYPNVANCWACGAPLVERQTPAAQSGSTKATVACPRCRAMNVPDASSCWSCQYQLIVDPVSTPTSPSSAPGAVPQGSQERPTSANAPPPPIGAPTERYFFNSEGVTVSSKLVSFGASRTFATANITSVAVTVIEPPVRAKPGTWLIITGIALVFLWGGLAIGAHDSSFVSLLVITGVLPIVAGILWNMVPTVPPSATYVLSIASAAGEIEALRSANRGLVSALESAIKHAIADRG